MFFKHTAMKKKFALLSALLVAAATAFPQATEPVQEINSPVQSAIIYLYGAEVTQSKTVTLNPGRNKILFEGLSAKLDAKSIQVNFSGTDVSILAISNAMNYITGQKESVKIRQLKDSVEMASDALTLINNEKDAYTLEKNMILKNEAIGGTDKGLAVAELKLAADFYRSRIREINMEISKLDKKRNTINQALAKTSQQLMELNAKNNQPTAEISILVNSAVKTTSTLTLKYLVTDAGWAPNYDLHAEDINQPIELKYRAQVYNNTGIDWNDIRIKLSTADPSKSASKPELTPWDLGAVNDGYAKRKFGAKSDAYKNFENQEGYSGNSISKDMDLKAVPQRQPSNVELVEIEIAELSAEFDIKTSYTIPADSKPYIVDVTEYKLPATYQHFSAPKLDRDAFLLARITGWEDLDLVEGPANIYYGGTYVGQSYIYTRNADDTLDLSLGRDNKVLVTRSKIKEFSSKKLIGNTTKETFAYEIVVKNNRKAPVQIEVQDQLPISTQSEITVDAIETTKAEYDPKTGNLVWTYSLQPGEAKKINLSYAVKYPKNMRINIQRTQTHLNVRFL